MLMGSSVRASAFQLVASLSSCPPHDAEDASQLRCCPVLSSAARCFMEWDTEDGWILIGGTLRDGTPVSVGVPLSVLHKWCSGCLHPTVILSELVRSITVTVGEQKLAAGCVTDGRNSGC